MIEPSPFVGDGVVMNSPSNLPSTDDSITTPSPTNGDGFSTPMPSHKDISIEIENFYGHMDPPPPSALALQTIQIRKRLDNIWGETDFDEDLSNEPDFSNQGCTSNFRFVDNGFKRLDTICGETVVDEDQSNEPDISNQYCTGNSRLVDNVLQQKWRDNILIQNPRQFFYHKCTYVNMH